MTTVNCDTCGRVFTHRHEKIALRSLTIHSCEKTIARAESKARRLARQAAVDKTPKPCHHKRTHHQHGTHACYVLDRCRCPECTAANTAYERQRSRLHAYGRFGNTWVDAAPVREHVQSLQAAGLGLKQIVAASGYSHGAMTKLMYGSQNTPPTKRIRAEHAQAILAVRATIDTLAGGATLDGTGTRRRLQALMAIGWSQSKLARHLGYEVRNFCMLIHGERDVTAKTARAARDLYDQLWDAQPPRATTGDKGAYTRSLRYAHARGWVPPLAWADDEIDDPTAVPDTGTDQRPGGGWHHDDLLEDITWLLDHEPLATAQRLADRLGYRNRDAIQNALRRAGRQDLLHQLARNARLHKEGTNAA
ncbi:MAG TPA: hypothetical protein VFJ94_03945 [Intrasporangium sp.]|uniref:hypothetical protein n=1 Tax=Intrasporangium sp. TaxID=1925024 RepID=UPI002D78A22E|nr:hypothetical protein [Intrasporangium sp.]HET7397655.1 hypothetical protein [Intrasporangium sp.]